MKGKLYRRFHFALSIMCILSVIVKLIFKIDSFYLSVCYVIMFGSMSIFNYIFFLVDRKSKYNLFYLSTSLANLALILPTLNTIIY